MNDLFDPRAKNDDPVTSHMAADSVDDLAAAHMNKIEQWLLSAKYGGTIYEIGAGAGLDHVAVARRMIEMERRGRAVRTDEKRLTPSKRKAQVWTS